MTKTTCCSTRFALFFITMIGIIFLSSSLSWAESFEVSFSGKNSGCNLPDMHEKYLGDNVADSCWYCKIVIIMTNAYLSAVGQALPVAHTLGKKLAEIGFIIWLAWYILQQVSATNETTPGKMLQEILVMGFKVALSIAAINQGTDLIRDYILNPIMLTGIDYGKAILDSVMPNVDTMTL